MKIKILILLALLAVAGASTASAEDSLEQRVAALENRVHQLEQRLAAMADAQTPQTKAAARKEVVINIAPDGAFVVDHQQLDLAGLSAKLSDLSLLQPKPAIVIRAPKGTGYNRVAKVLDACKAAGLSDVAFAEPSSE